MKRIKMALMAMVAVFAIGAVGASAASAGNGHIDTNIGSCDFTFSGTYSDPDSIPAHTPPWDESWDLYDFAPDPEGECDVADFNAELHVHWDDVTGDAEAIGSITVPGIVPAFGNCTFSGTLTGTWNGSRFELDDPSTQTIPRTGGSAFNCLVGSVDVLSNLNDTPPGTDYTWLQP